MNEDQKPDIVTDLKELATVSAELLAVQEKLRKVEQHNELMRRAIIEYFEARAAHTLYVLRGGAKEVMEAAQTRLLIATDDLQKMTKLDDGRAQA